MAGHPVPLRSAALPNLPCCAGALYCHLVHSLGTVEQNVTMETAALTMGSQHLGRLNSVWRGAERERVS